MGEAASVAKSFKATKVEILGYRATTGLSNGKKFVEAESIAAKRANKVGEMLTGLSVASASTHAKTEPAACDGVTDADKRRVIIKITQ